MLFHYIKKKKNLFINNVIIIKNYWVCSITIFEVMFPKNHYCYLNLAYSCFSPVFQKRNKRITCLVTIFVMKTKKNRENMKNTFNYYYNYFWF